MIIEFNNRVKKLISQHQTRKQLLNLPDHLLKDIAVSKEQLQRETNKNGLLNTLGKLIRGA